MVPDVAGLTLGKAREALAAAEVELVTVKVTSPPKQKSSYYDDDYRVIRLEMVDFSKAELLVCKPL